MVRLRRAAAAAVEEEHDDEENDAGAVVGLAVVAADEESVSSLLVKAMPAPDAGLMRGRIDEMKRGRRGKRTQKGEKKTFSLSLTRKKNELLTSTSRRFPFINSLRKRESNEASYHELCFFFFYYL